MSDLEQAAQEAAPEVVQTEVVEQTAEAPEAAESTQGQVETQPAEDQAQAEAEEKSKSAERRERRKAKIEEDARRLREAEAEAAQAKAEVDRVKAAAASLTEPKQADFANYEKYQAALTAYYVAQGTSTGQLQQIEAQAKAKHDRALQARQVKAQEDALNWAAQTQEAATKYDDFGDAIKVAADVNVISQPLSEMIMGSEVAADVAYHLGKNPELGRRISALNDPVAMARELGRVEAQLSAPQAKTVSTAPAPINPVKPKSSAAPINEKTASADEWRAYRLAGGT